MKYYLLIKATGKTLPIDPNPEAQRAFFQIIENATGLDRVIAEPLLKNVKPIDHPDYKFFSKSRA